MNKINTILFKAALGAATVLSIGSVALAQTPTAPAPAATNKLDSEARGFLSEAAESGHLEIAGSKLALQKSQNAQVKAFAQKMVDDHAKVGQKLDALAKSKGFEPPTEPSLVQKAKLKALDLRDDSFDKAYADEIGVAAHEDAVKLFEKASKDVKDPDVKQFATETLPSLNQHLQEAKALQQSVAAKAK
ncbi:hypothetical protein D3C87_287420 [compost metagenome]